MIILTKKKITYQIVIILMVISIIGFIAINSNKKEIKTVETVALPINNKVIVIDAGHGVPDEGAQSKSRNNGS